jgi:ribonuclease BN (tRNA processing enzyme)
VTANGRTLAYTGDTGLCPALDELAAEADLLLAEASFRDGDDNPADLHLTGRQAGELATRAGARRLVLTHVPPWHRVSTMLAEASSVYAGPLDAATPGATYPVS